MKYLTEEEYLKKHPHPYLEMPDGSWHRAETKEEIHEAFLQIDKKTRAGEMG